MQLYSINRNDKEKVWPDCTKLPNYLEFSSLIDIPLSKILENTLASKDALEVIESLLTLNPNKRPSVNDVIIISYK